MAPFDIIVIAAIAIGGLIGFVTGFVRGGLFVMSWFGSIGVTVYAFPYIKPYARAEFGDDLMIDLATAGVIFLVSLIILHLISHAIGERVRRSRLSALDRSLGFLAGLAVPAVILCLGYVMMADSIPQDWVQEARTRPLVEQGAVWLRRMLPDNMRRESDEVLRQGRGAMRSLDEALPPMRSLLGPPLGGEPAPQQGYNPEQREALDQMLRDRPE